MEAYTKVHKDSEGMDKARREINCLKTIFPALFRSLESDDLLEGLIFCPSASAALQVLAAWAITVYFIN